MFSSSDKASVGSSDFLWLVFGFHSSRFNVIAHVFIVTQEEKKHKSTKIWTEKLSK